jgi:lysyl-tRNA synthetase class 2
MKKLLGAGMQKIFTLTKVFRNEESLGGQHNPEFTMLEWYQQGADYQACMSETEELIRYVASALDKPISDEVFEKVRLEEVFAELDLNLAQATREDLRKNCNAHGIRTQDDDTESDLFYRLYLEKIEPAFKDRNLFIYDYPKYQAALAAFTPDGNFGQRFECFMNGLELCNGFTELTDADEQRARFEEEAREREAQGKKVFPIDEALLSLLPSIQSPTYGNALGVDRLHMVLTGRTRIQDVLLFPGEELFKD